MSEFSDKVHGIVQTDLAADREYAGHLDYIKSNRDHWDDADVAADLGKMLTYYFEANRRLVVDGREPERSDSLEKIYRQYESGLTSQNKIDMLQSLSMIVFYETDNGIKTEDAGCAKVREFVESIYYISTDEIYRDIGDGTITAFTFRPFSKYALKDICLNEITLCNPDRFNDPFDTVFPHWIDYTLNRHKDKKSAVYRYQLMMKDVFRSVRARSLVLAANDNVRKLPKLMWAHYADEHKGFCIKYKIDKNFFFSHHDDKSVMAGFKMNYINDDFRFDSNIHLSKALMSKCNIWKYEKEFRILMFNPEFKTDYISLSLNEHFKMTDIYLGLRCQEDDQRLMESLLQDKPIKLHRMKEKLPFAYRLDCDFVSKKK